MAGDAAEQGLMRLPHTAAPIGRAISRVMSRPVAVAIACLVVLAGLAWIFLALSVAGWAARGNAAALGPGMGVFDLLTRRAGLDLVGRAALDVLCRPSFGAAGWHAGESALVFLMWAAMTLAMMLPTAAGMIVTYAQIADTAARKGEPAVSPLILTAGYVMVWLGFAAAATALQAALARAALIDPAMASASGLFSGAIFVAAGAYQFSALKQACVTRCQRPFPFFFANWSVAPRAIFRLGARQGLYCLGCCWATMLVMFAVGVMNVLWMAGLGMLMTAEKLATTMRLSRAAGVIFAAIGVVLIASAIIAHWPHPS
jgi:predicted metal-binding membrane protein